MDAKRREELRGVVARVGWAGLASLRVEEFLSLLDDAERVEQALEAVPKDDGSCCECVGRIAAILRDHHD